MEGFEVAKSDSPRRCGSAGGGGLYAHSALCRDFGDINEVPTAV